MFRQTDLFCFYRHGHAVAVAGDVAFLFGGVSSINQEVTLYFLFKAFLIQQDFEVACFTLKMLRPKLNTEWCAYFPLVSLGGQPCLLQ